LGKGVVVSITLIMLQKTLQQSDWLEYYLNASEVLFFQTTSRDVQIEAEIVLCSECASFLIHGEEQNMKNVWPAFICNVLRNAVITGHCRVVCDGHTFQ
jgi:hypothetical protein